MMSLFPILRLGEVIYEHRQQGSSDVVVVVPLYNYEQTIVEALGSVVNQDLSKISLVVVDDCSTDGGCKVAVSFIARQAYRFVTARVIRHLRNQGLSMARNSGIVWSIEPYLFFLDADNRIRPSALSALLRALHNSGAAFAYSQLRLFGEESGIGNADIWDPSRLRSSNYIDAMAMIRRYALERAGGYAVLADDHGWEDYDLWCRFADLHLEGVFLPELLCEYRVHSTSMLRTRTNHHAMALMAEMALRHPRLFSPEPGSFA
jgi:glycosyltransferase involved in cell wall biosynthesis